MRQLLAVILSIVYYIIFGLLLLVFHAIQVIAYNFFGYTAHKKTVDVLNFLLIQNLYTLFCRPSFHGFNTIPEGKPLIIIANHQSMYDISPIAWGFRKHHTKFISKKELGKYLPSISYNLKKGGSVLIDRDSGMQSIKEILRLGKNIEQKNYSVCIFPEGTRSKDGNVKEFQPAGLKTLLKAAPSALIIPFVIDGNYKLHTYGKFPLNIGLKLKYTALEPISRENVSEDELLKIVEERIKATLKKNK